MTQEVTTLTTENLEQRRAEWEREHQNPRTNRAPLQTYVCGGRTFHGRGWVIVTKS